jgi:hypothetical protein
MLVINRQPISGATMTGIAPAIVVPAQAVHDTVNLGQQISGTLSGTLTKWIPGHLNKSYPVTPAISTYAKANYTTYDNSNDGLSSCSVSSNTVGNHSIGLIRQNALPANYGNHLNNPYAPYQYGMASLGQNGLASALWERQNNPYSSPLLGAGSGIYGAGLGLSMFRG